MNYTISIVGFGNIGKYLSGLLLSKKNISCRLNILDSDWKVLGGILDLEHALELYPESSLSFNSQELLDASDFIFHCAGASVPRGKSRLLTCQSSIEITELAFKDFKPSKDCKIIVVANPVEIISFITQRITGLPKSNILGTGTYLDSIRMNYLVKRTNPTYNGVNAILLGEHGTTAFLSQSLSTIDGNPFSTFLSEDTLEELMNSVKASAEEIKKTQKATIYGVSFCAFKLFESLLSNESSLFPVSTYIPNHLIKELGHNDIYLSLFSELSHKGVKPISSYSPEENEIELLKKSVKLIMPAIPRKYL